MGGIDGGNYLKNFVWRVQMEEKMVGWGFLRVKCGGKAFCAPVDQGEFLDTGREAVGVHDRLIHPVEMIATPLLSPPCTHRMRIPTNECSTNLPSKELYNRRTGYMVSVYGIRWQGEYKI